MPFNNPKMPFKTKITPNGTVVRMYNKSGEWYVYAGTTKIHATDVADADRIYNNI